MTVGGQAGNDDGGMGIWTQARTMVAAPRRRFVAALCAMYHSALGLARELRADAERSPYPQHAQSLLVLADTADSQASALAEELRRLGSAPDHPPLSVARPPGRNHWERLTADLARVQEFTKRYLELAQHWDVMFEESAATLTRLVHDTREMERAIGELIARSDPHASD